MAVSGQQSAKKSSAVSGQQSARAPRGVQVNRAFHILQAESRQPIATLTDG